MTEAEIINISASAIWCLKYLLVGVTLQ